MPKEFKFDAFISYRHTELDKFVAEHLHKELESFHLPRSLAKKRKGMKNKIKRVFRDQEELPLTDNLDDPITHALESSEWLIVICSPRLKESLWCKKEIETFVALHGRDHVLAVLIEGESSKSFPDELLYREQEIEKPDGTKEKVTVRREPLAADIRGKNRKEMLKKLKVEILRLEASMFGVDFDDLRQRHRERRMRRIARVSLIVGAACLAFGVYSTFTAMRIQKQKEQIETQSAQILEQNKDIKSKSDEIQKQNEEIAKQNEELALKHAKSLAEEAERYLAEGDRDAAVKTALEALTESDGVAMPYTPEAEMILAESLRVYDTGNVYKAEYQYVAECKINNIIPSDDLDTLAVLDAMGGITLLDTNALEVIETIPAQELYSNLESSLAFLGADRFLYISKDKCVCIYNLNDREVEHIIEESIFTNVVTDVTGKYIVTGGYNNDWNVYDGCTYERISQISNIEGYTDMVGPYIFPDGIIIYASLGKESEEYVHTLHFENVNTGEIILEYSLGTKTLIDIDIRDGVVYMLLAEYPSLLVPCKGYTVAVSLADGEQLWESVQKGTFPKLMKLPDNAEADVLLIALGQNAQLIHMQTGEVIGMPTVSSDIISVYGYDSNDNFLMFCKDGMIHKMSMELNYCADMSHLFDCVTTENKIVLRMKDKIVSFKENDKRIVFYTNQLGPHVQELNEEVKRTAYAGTIAKDEAYEIAVSYGLDNPQYIEQLFYSDDEKYCFIEYGDNTKMIYEVGVGIRTIISTAEDMEGYIDAGADGKSYLLCLTGCYMLNADMQPIAWIDHVKDVDAENGVLYMEQGSRSFSSPIYTTDELIQMAKEWK